MIALVPVRDGALPAGAAEAIGEAGGRVLIAGSGTADAAVDGLASEVFLAEIGQDEPGLNRLIRAAFTLLGLQTYFTAGVKEVRAWTVAIGATAPQAAGVIHTDFERGFIRAEIYSVDDLVELKTEKAIKEAGRMRIEGKAYTMRDGDVCHFLFNV